MFLTLTEFNNFLKKTFTATYTELDFSENIAIKPLYKVQSAHISGKYSCLHCEIVVPREIKYEYHL